MIDLTCDLDSDSDGDVLIVGEEAAPTPAPYVAPVQVPDVSGADLGALHIITTDLSNTTCVLGISHLGNVLFFMVAHFFPWFRPR